MPPTGPGGLPHLAGELFKLTAKIDIVHVPYRGAAPAVNDLLGQQVQMAFLDLPVLLPQIKAGALRPIAIGSPRARADRAGRADHGGSRHAGSADRKLVRHGGAGGTPPAIVAALNRIATEAMRDPAGEGKTRRARAPTLVGDTPEHFRGFIDSRNQRNGRR